MIAYYQYPYTISFVTDSPIQSIWHELSMLTEPNNVQRFMFHKHGTIPGIKLANAVSSWMGQARSFFTSAETAPLIAKPLYLYYGQMNLAKAVIGICQQAMPNPYHGMSRKSSGGRGSNSILSWAVKINSTGVHPEFADTFGVNPSRGKAVSLKSLISRDAEAADHLIRYLGIQRDVHIVHDVRTTSMAHGRGKVKPALAVDFGSNTPGALRIGEVYGKAPGVTLSGTTIYVPTTARLRQRAGVESLPSGLLTISMSLSGQNMWWPSVVRQLSIGWILSEICRYRPELLLFPPSNQERALIPILEVVIANILREYPNACLNKIYGVEKFYGSFAVGR